MDGNKRGLTTGDFDLCSSWQEELEQEMLALGFVRPSGPGSMLRGLVHPDLKLGFEVVASVPMDGAGDANRVRLVQPEGETGKFRIIPVEDLIADRMGQWASKTAPDRIDQARVLFALHPDADMAYLERRIREETFGDHGIEDINS